MLRAVDKDIDGLHCLRVILSQFTDFYNRRVGVESSEVVSLAGVAPHSAWGKSWTGTLRSRWRLRWLRHGVINGALVSEVVGNKQAADTLVGDAALTRAGYDAY